MIEMRGVARDVLPFLGMVMVECCEIGMVTIGKAAMNAGMSNFVYVVYYNALGTLLLLPYCLIHKHRSVSPPPTSSLMFRFFLLGLIGICLLQVLAYAGINLSSPTLAAALGNLIPAFTFLLAIIFRMESLDLRKSSSQAKSMGTIVAVTGAFIMTLYRGPTVFSAPSAANSSTNKLLAQPSNWVLGGLAIAISCILSSGWNILQTATIKEYPERTTVVFFSCLFGSIQSAIFTLILGERSPDAWLLLPGIGMIAVVYSAVFGTVIRSNMITWCLERKGPLFVAMFKPLGMIIAVIMGMIFLGDALYLGSVLGGVVIAIGFYTVIWGQAEETTVLEEIITESDPSNKTTPFLANPAKS